jgi:hypothetical protein
MTPIRTVLVFAVVGFAVMYALDRNRRKPSGAAMWGT